MRGAGRIESTDYESIALSGEPLGAPDLLELNLKLPKISTVEGFQGQERKKNYYFGC